MTTKPDPKPQPQPLAEGDFGSLFLQQQQVRLLEKMAQTLFHIEHGLGSVTAALFAMADALHCQDRLIDALDAHAKETEAKWKAQRADFGFEPEEESR